MNYRILINAGILALLIWAGINTGRTGLSRLFTEFSSTSNSLTASERALEYNSNDAEAHYARALQITEPAEAVSELERAKALRPGDYFLWQELGRLREESGDSQGAIEAFRTATSLAPYYAQPHWQLGNALLRAEQTKAAFVELRMAATSDPDLFPALMDLAFGINEGDAVETIKFVAVQNDHERSLLAEFLLEHQCRDAAVELVKSLQNVGNEDRQLLVSSLITAEEFSLAYGLWLNGRGTADRLFDGDFESSISSVENGFGWQPTRLTQTVKLLLDTDRPQSGKRSLRIDYAGNFDEGTPVISQLIPVDSHSRYAVTFSARSENLFSAGLPIVNISEALGEHPVLGESAIMISGTKGWNASSFEFQTGIATRAVKLNLQRTPCNVKPCPITGKLWLDGFAVTKLN